MSDPRLKRTSEVPENDPELKHAFARIAKSEDGVKVLRELMNLCGYKEPSMVMNPTTHEILANSTLWNESKRGVWLEFRKLFPKKQINIIEMER